MLRVSCFASHASRGCLWTEAPARVGGSLLSWPDRARLESRYPSQRLVVPVEMKDGELVPQRTGSDQAIDTRPDRQPRSPGRPVELDGVQEDLRREGRFYDR